MPIGPIATRHSCPPDEGTYVCGDLGHCDQCADNDYCAGGRPRVPKNAEPSTSQRGPRLDAPTEAPRPQPIPLLVTESTFRFVPNREDTPGAIKSDVTQENIRQTVCVPGWTDRIRPPSSYINKLKEKQMREWGLPGTASDSHEDHLVPLCVGGAPRDPANLWPQPRAGRWADKFKNQLEGSVCRAVCRGDMTLKEGQAVFLEEPNWTKAYLKVFGLE